MSPHLETVFDGRGQRLAVERLAFDLAFHELQAVNCQIVRIAFSTSSMRNTFASER